MATVYLHIGTPKTATSAIQVFMGSNNKALKQHGIYYPIFPERWPLTRRERNAHFLKMGFKLEGPGYSSEPSEVYFTGLQHVVDAAAQQEIVFLSDEELWPSSAFIENFWERLHADLAERGLELKVIVYLRRQDLFMESRWKQNIKMHGIDTFPIYLQKSESKGYPLDYYKRLEEIAAVVGRENIIVRVFERGQFKNGSVYEDFLSIIGLELDDSFVIKHETVNESIEGVALMVKRYINRFGEMRLTHAALQKALLALPHPHGKYTVFATREVQEEYLAQFEEGNAQVAREYLGREDGVLFYDQIQDLPRIQFKVREVRKCFKQLRAQMVEQGEKECVDLLDRAYAEYHAEHKMTPKRFYKGVLRRLGFPQD